MPGYLPLCASRQSLLPAACRDCAWWQTTGGGRGDTDAAGEKRRQWMTALESTWGSTGLLLEGGNAAKSGGLPPEQAGLTDRSTDPVMTASIHFAPAAAVPRLRDIPFAPLAPRSVLLFCLRSEGGRGKPQAKRLLHKALERLKERDIQEVYAFASFSGSPEDLDRCEFFSLRFLEANGFQRLRDNGDIYLMRADLRGLLSLIAQVETAVRRVLRNDPTPSPAAWTRRETS
jgi:hypothetical protein